MLTGFKTYIASGLTAIFGVLAVVDWNPVIANKGAGISVIAMSVLMAILRSVTTTPPAGK